MNYKIVFDDGTIEKFKCHPIYRNYASNKNGNVINLNTMRMIGHIKSDGYVELSLRFEGKTIHVYCHNFVYECYNGIYSRKNDNGETIVIKHLDNIKHHNNIDNLMLDTQSNNSKDAYKDGISPKRSGKPRKCRGRSIDEDKWTEYKSTMDAERQTGCPNRSIHKVCSKNYKSTTSKTDHKKYFFEFN
jgi:hypothetical protein